MPDALHREGLETKTEEEVDTALLELEQALHRREGLILVTSKGGVAHHAVIRAAVARYEDAFAVAVVSAAREEPVAAVDKLLDQAGDVAFDAPATEEQDALGRMTEEAARLGRPILVVVEDAQFATMAQLERLRTKLRIHDGPVRAVQLVLAGSQKLSRRLKKHDARAISTRVTTRIEVEDKQAEQAKLAGGQAAQPRPDRRSFLITVASAGVLTAALLVIVTLASRTEAPNLQRAANTTVQPARSIDAASQPAATAGVRPQAASPSAVAPASPAAGTAMQPSSAPAVPTRDVEDAPERAEAGPKVSEVMGVETVRGTPLRKPAATGQDTANAADATTATAAAPAGPQAPAAPPAASAASVQTPGGAQVVSLEGANARVVQPSTPAIAAIPGAAPAPPAPAVSAATTAAHPSATPAPPAAAPGAMAAAQPTAAPIPTPAAPAATATAQPSAAPAPMPATPPNEHAAVATAAAQAPPATTPGAPAASAAAPTAVKPAPAAPVVSGSAPAGAPTAAAKPFATASASSSGGVEFQVAALATAESANALKNTLAREFTSVRIEEASRDGKAYFRVRVGPFNSIADANRAEQRLKAMGHTPLRYGRAKKAG